jgi:hypothetical protein
MTFNLIAAFLGFAVLKPMRVRHFAASRAAFPDAAALATKVDVTVRI